MAGRSGTGQFTIELADDRLSATLTVPPGLVPTDVTEQAVRAELEAAGLAMQSTWEPVIGEAVQRYQQMPGELVELVLEGTPPTPGQDGWFEWDAQCDPERQTPAGGNGDPTDFYSHSPFTIVVEGQRLGCLHAPVVGEAGVMVTGDPAPPPPVDEADLAIDPTSVQLAGDGECTALVTGVLHHDDGTLRIDPCLQIKAHVDFSTGHIRFAGDVIVREGVRDLFQVHATGTGSVQVMGLVEAAHIIAGQDFNADGGMAGREKGRVEVGRDMNARHLSGVSGTVRRHLSAERELVNCRLTVGGELRAERAALIGGSVAVAGRVVLRELGSQAGHETRLALGSAPAIEAGMTQAATMIGRIDKQLSDGEGEVFSMMTHRGGAAAEEMLNQFKLASHSLKRRRDELQARHDALEALLHKRRHVELVVHEAIHPGVMLIYGRQALTFKQPLEGPLVIGHKPGEPADLFVKQLTTGDQRPLIELARLRVLAADDPLRQPPDHAG